MSDHGEMNTRDRERPSSLGRRLALRAVLGFLVAAICGAILCGYAVLRDSREDGIELNRRAWRRTYEERNLPVPELGPREGYWGVRLGPKAEDEHLSWREPEFELEGIADIDERGFQYAGPASAPGCRILILGGSAAFGAYASSIEHTYYSVLARDLERRGSPCSIVVLAAAAWKAMQEVEALRIHGAAVDPDLVVMLDGLNELTAGASASSVYDWGEPDRHEQDYEARVRAYLRLVDEAAGLADELDSELLVVLQPSLAERKNRTSTENRLLELHLAANLSSEEMAESYEAMRRGLESRASRRGLHTLDASRIFDGEEATTFADLWHFSDPGHAILGRSMAEEISRVLEARRRQRRKSADRPGSSAVQ